HRFSRTCRSEWLWESMNPGATTSPLQSITCAWAEASNVPTSAMRSPSIRTSAVLGAAPVPSISVPPLNRIVLMRRSPRALGIFQRERTNLIAELKKALLPALGFRRGVVIKSFGVGRSAPAGLDYL